MEVYRQFGLQDGIDTANGINSRILNGMDKNLEPDEIQKTTLDLADVFSRTLLEQYDFRQSFAKRSEANNTQVPMAEFTVGSFSYCVSMKHPAAGEVFIGLSRVPVDGQGKKDETRKENIAISAYRQTFRGFSPSLGYKGPDYYDAGPYGNMRNMKRNTRIVRDKIAGILYDLQNPKKAA